MQWLRVNTDKDAVIASWWDYGYWISALSERKTLADNATVLDFQIKKIAAMYMTTPDNAWNILTNDAKTYTGEILLGTTFTEDDSVATNLDERKIELFASWKEKDRDGD